MPRLLTRPLLVLVLCLGAFAARPCAAQGDALEELFGERNRKQRALPEDPDELVAELARRGRYQRALNVLDALASKAPLDQSQLLAKGRILLTVGRFDELGELVESGLAERPESDALWLLRARRAELSSQLDGAVMAYRKVIELNPRGIEGTEARVRLGFVLRDLGRLGEGQALWLSLVSSYERDENPDPSARELFMTGLACRGLDLCKEVKQQFSKPMYKYVQVMFDQALRLDRGDIELLCAYGEAFSDKFNFADARKLLARAVELNGAYPDARVALAEALLGSYELGFARFDQARRHLDAALEVDALHAGALAALAALELSDGRYEAALEITARGLKRSPADVDLRVVRAAVGVFRGDATALEVERAALFLVRPRCARFFAELANLVGGRFRYAEARDLAARALEIEPDEPLALATYGLNLTRTGRLEEGVEVLGRAQRADPFNVYVWNTLKVLTKVFDPAIYEVHDTEHFKLRIPVAESSSAPFILKLLERAWHIQGDKYGVKPDKVYVEFYSDITDFSARSIGLPFIGALGVCFGNTMTILSAREDALGTQSWGRTLWHEYAHVLTLTRTGNRVPRWLTEGISVYEESRGMDSWVREYDRALMTARRCGLILPLSEFDAGFSRPRFPGQVMLSYFQGGLICEFIEQRWGFSKLLDLLDRFGEGRTLAEAVERVFDMSLASFDARLLAFMDRRYAGYQPSVLSPNPFASMLQGVALNREREQLRRSISESPDDLKARARLARVYVALGKKADATTHAQAAQRLATLRMRAVGELARAQLGRGVPGAGVALAAAALELRGVLADASLVLGLVELAERRVERARVLLVEALELGTSDRALAEQRLAALAFDSEKWAVAARRFEAVARLVPPEAQVHRRLRICYLKMGRKARADEELIKICQLDSTDLASRLKVGQLLFDRGRWPELVDVLEDVELIDPFQTVASYQLAEGYRRTGRPRRALRSYGSALATVDAKIPQAKVIQASCSLGQALCHEALGELDEARGRARQALTFDADLEEATRLLERLQERAGEEG